MEHYSILDQSAPRFRPEGVVSAGDGNGESRASVSAALAAANAHPGMGRPSGLTLGLPGDGREGSLSEMAERDLDAALQLLVDRAQYITGASGAAIALRRTQQSDMLCRASVGANAPGLGTLLSSEAGLSGESVRTRMPLRCDDAASDSRVNREGCRELGIASVMIMPIESDDQVLGVFELFSGKVNAFGERDLSTLQRLAGMVETAVKLTQAAAVLPEGVADLAETQPSVEEPVFDDPVFHEPVLEDPAVEELEVTSLGLQREVEEDSAREVLRGEVLSDGPVAELTQAPAAATSPPVAEVAAPAELPKKALFWSAAASAGAAAQTAEEPSNVPAVLRNLHKCQACNFPVSEGRKLCVECEEKQWRGLLRYPRPAEESPVAAEATKGGFTNQAPRRVSESSPAGAAVAPAKVEVPVSQTFSELPATATMTQAQAAGSASAASSVGVTVFAPEPSVAVPLSVAENPAPVEPPPARETPGDAMEQPAPPAFLSGGVNHESWLSRNKYVLGALLVVAGAVAGIVLLR
jgi:hypothetical protein